MNRSFLSRPRLQLSFLWVAISGLLSTCHAAQQGEEEEKKYPDIREEQADGPLSAQSRLPTALLAQMHSAIAQEDVQGLEDLLTHWWGLGHDINTPDPHDRTFLDYARPKGAVYRFLSEEGGRPSRTSVAAIQKKKQTPAYEAGQELKGIQGVEPSPQKTIVQTGVHAGDHLARSAGQAVPPSPASERALLSQSPYPPLQEGGVLQIPLAELHKAISKNDLLGFEAALEVFLGFGGNINTPDSKGRTLLDYARGRPAINCFLLANGGISGLALEENFFAACDAGHLERVVHLLREGADPTITDQNETTPVHQACYKGRLEVVKLLLGEAEVDPVKPNKWGVTPFFSACDAGQLEIVKLLLQDERVDPNTSTSEKWTPFHTACRKGHTALVAYLLDQPRINPCTPTTKGWTPFCSACDEGHLEVVKLLLQDQRIDVTLANQNGCTPFHRACYRGHIEVVSWLLKSRRIDPHAPDNSRATPFFSACLQGHLEIVQLLLAETDPAIDPSIPTTKGYTPFSAACAKGRLEVVRVLLQDQRIEPTIPDKAGWTALDMVYENMKKVASRAEWERYSTIWDIVVEKGGQFHKKRDIQGSLPKKPNPAQMIT